MTPRDPLTSPRLTRGIAELREHPAWMTLAGVVVTLVLSWVIADRSGEPSHVNRHLFYVPVILAAVRFGLAGALATGVAATLLAGPLGPGGPSVGVWTQRGLFLVGIGVLVAWLVRAAQSALVANLHLVERERELALQRAALIQTVSHEFRTPLTVIRGVAETFASYPEFVADRVTPLVASLGRASARLEEMVSVVLAAGDALDADLLTEEALVVNDLLGEVVAGLQYRRDRVRIDVHDEARTIVTSHGYARLLLRCLLDNALKFSPEDEPVQVTVRRDGDEVVIEVADRGPGIEPVFTDRAFEPFTQADPSTARAHGGLGMGLFTARRLAQRLGGDVRLGSGPDRGLVATVHLPQRREADLHLTARGTG